MRLGWCHSVPCGTKQTRARSEARRRNLLTLKYYKVQLRTSLKIIRRLAARLKLKVQSQKEAVKTAHRVYRSCWEMDSRIREAVSRLYGQKMLPFLDKRENNLTPEIQNIRNDSSKALTFHVIRRLMDQAQLSMIAAERAARNIESCRESIVRRRTDMKLLLKDFKASFRQRKKKLFHKS